MYTILHLLGDPIDTIASLLLVLKRGQTRAEQLRDSCNDTTTTYVEAMREQRDERARSSRIVYSPSSERRSPMNSNRNATGVEQRDARPDALDPDQLWKAVTLIVISYDECGDCGDVLEFFRLSMSVLHYFIK